MIKNLLRSSGLWLDSGKSLYKISWQSMKFIEDISGSWGNNIFMYQTKNNLWLRINQSKVFWNKMSSSWFSWRTSLFRASIHSYSLRCDTAGLSCCFDCTCFFLWQYVTPGIRHVFIISEQKKQQINFICVTQVWTHKALKKFANYLMIPVSKQSECLLFDVYI